MTKSLIFSFKDLLLAARVAFLANSPHADQAQYGKAFGARNQIIRNMEKRFKSDDVEPWSLLHQDLDRFPQNTKPGNSKRAERFLQILKNPLANIESMDDVVKGMLEPKDRGKQDRLDQARSFIYCQAHYDLVQIEFDQLAMLGQIWEPQPPEGGKSLSKQLEYKTSEGNLYTVCSIDLFYKKSDDTTAKVTLYYKIEHAADGSGSWIEAIRVTTDSVAFIQDLAVKLRAGAHASQEIRQTISEWNKKSASPKPSHSPTVFVSSRSAGSSPVGLSSSSPPIDGPQSATP